MATLIINNTDDFIRALRENDEFLAAARREIYTQDLLALPGEFRKHVKESGERFDRIDKRFDKIDGNVVDLKGHIANISARERAPIVAAEMDLEWRRTMTTGETVAVWQTAHRSGMTEGISRGDRSSFWGADLIFEALDTEGKPCYVVVEASYTATPRDTDRSIRNAEFLTRFTGVPTYAAITSVYVDNRIKNDLIEDNPQPHGQADEEKVFWSKREEPNRPS